jgi:SAM-dependent methyltransferase
MGFDVAAAAYDRFMGRYSRTLAPQLADLAGVRAGQRALDVGSGPGALTAELAARLGEDAVTAIEPSAPFVAALRERLPGVAVTQGSAEALPFGDGEFDVALSQLVVHFMADPVAGLAEMARVTRTGGVVAASVWDFGGGTGPISTFWAAVQDLDPANEAESGWAGTRDGHLVELCAEAGLTAEQRVLTVTVPYATFEEWWHPYTLRVGPAGDYVAGLPADAEQALKERCRARLPEAPFEVSASAWCVTATV